MFKVSIMLLTVGSLALAGQANEFVCNSKEAKPKYASIYTTTGFTGVGSLSVTIDGKSVAKPGQNVGLNHVKTAMGTVVSLNDASRAAGDGTAIHYSIIAPSVELKNPKSLEYKYESVLVISHELAAHRAPNPDHNLADPANTFIPVSCVARQVFFATSKFQLEEK